MSADMARRRAVVSPRTVTADTRNFIVEKVSGVLLLCMEKLRLENLKGSEEHCLLGQNTACCVLS